MSEARQYQNRHASQHLTDLFKTFSAVAVTGARQVGKTTLLKSVFPDYSIITFDPIIDVQNAKADPELFLNTHTPPIILDEIQYAPELIPALKRRIDEARKPGSYLITGSQQWNVMKHLGESLAGRVVFLDLDCFNLAETVSEPKTNLWLKSWLEQDSPTFAMLPIKRSLFEQVWTGLLPEAQYLPQSLLPDFFQAYVRTYVERDVRLMAEIADVALFTRFYRLCAVLTAQEINSSHAGRELGISPQTSARWRDMLEASFQWFSIPPFTRNAVKKIAHKSKGYFLDTGLASWAQGMPSPETLMAHPQWGGLFETFIVVEIRKQMRLIAPQAQLYHWRAHSGAEVDLVIEYAGKYYPIEIKGKSRPSRPDTSGITAFREAHPRLEVARGLVMCAGEEFYALTENDWVLSWKARSGLGLS